MPSTTCMCVFSTHISTHMCVFQQSAGIAAQVNSGCLVACTCRLNKQELARGYTSKDSDQATERLMQMFKTAVRRRASHKPHLAYVNQQLRARKLLRLGTPSAPLPPPPMPDRDSWTWASKPTVLSHQQIALVTTAVQHLFSTGHQLRNDKWQHMQWSKVRTSLHSARSYSSACMPGSGGKITVLGKSKVPVLSRVNHFVQADYAADNSRVTADGRVEVVSWVGIVHHLISLEHPEPDMVGEQQGQMQLQLALTEWLEPAPTASKTMPPLGRVLKAARKPTVKLEAAPLTDFVSKLAHANHSAPGKRWGYFMPMGRTY